MHFWEQFALQLVSPVVGTALIGTVAALIARKYQERKLDHDFRMNLVSSTGEIASAIHTELSFYERWVRHSQPPSPERAGRRAEVDKIFIDYRKKLGSLQTEIDAYFEEASEPGIALHRLADLAMLRYAIILDLPDSQVMELVDHLGQPGHSGYTIQQLDDLLARPKPSDTTMWSATQKIEESFTTALHDTMRKLLATHPITSTEGFKSRKLLTAYDQRDLHAREESGVRASVGDPVPSSEA